MWESLVGIADGLIESVGEGVTQVLDGRVDLEVQKLQETRKDPDVLKSVEPVKATRTDGSTIVGNTNKAGEVIAPKPAFMGVDKQTLMIGGGVLTALILGVAFVVRGRG